MILSVVRSVFRSSFCRHRVRRVHGWQVGSGRKTRSVLGKDAFRCQERNSGRDWGTVAGNIPFRSLVSPLALVQESINVLGKCAVQVSVLVVENHSDGYPENIFRIWNTLLLVQSTFDIRMDATVG